MQLNDKDKNGNKQAIRELDDIFYTFERFEDGMPHSRQLRGQLYELRPGRYRIFIFAGRLNWYYLRCSRKVPSRPRIMKLTVPKIK